MNAELILYCVQCPVCKSVINVNNKDVITLHHDCWVKVLKDMEALKKK